ncbi:MAG: hypothetical protein DRH26_04560 [Deltaproteobacteria bacterium]|nr:MAG: hypothetical protein DRH26_04560 [Deltaproteobacteria bacterium]
MVNIFLTLLCFSGFVYASIHGLRIKPSNAPLFSISSIGVLLFFFSMLNHLKMGAFFLIFSGFALSLFWIPVYLQKLREKSLVPFFQVPSVFLILAIICFILTINMTFTVVDDYVYWGIMGKYLYINNNLPATGCPLDPRILAYTPGTSLIHYFFLVLTGRYNVHISYFAQNIILISALFVVVTKENIKTSIVYMGVLIILMTVFFGSIFTKLQVDYLLSIICFSIFWIYYTEKNIYLKLLTVSMPLCFLFLVKEIGFMLGLLIAAAIFFDVLKDNAIGVKNKFKPLVFIILISGILLILKKLWLGHVNDMGFLEFHNAINWESIKTTFHIFSNGEIQKGFLIFIKESIFGPADRLNIPYLFWYVIIAFLWVRILSTFQNKDKPRFFLFSGLTLISFFLYMFLLYCLQIIIFKVGSAYEHTVGFSRYLNILFSPIVFIVAIIFFHKIVFTKKKAGRKIVFPLIGVVLLVLGFSRVEVYLNRENQDIQIQKFSDRIGNRINKGINSIGLITGRNDNIANLQFLYHLLPNTVDLSGKKKFINQNELIQYIVKYDYVLLYNPEPIILDWLEPCIGKETRAEKISFLHVRKDKSKEKLFKGFSLEMVLL